jgi:hypothetical protein
MIMAIMRRSREIPACALLLAASGAIAGCQQHRDCVDSYGFKQPESYCSSGVHTGSHYIYGGRSGGRYGDAVSGGSSSPSEGVSRGGFGHGGGGEGE